MEIMLLKNHNGSKAGSVHDVTPEAANYLVRCNVAQYTGNVNIENTQVTLKVEPKARKTRAPKQNKQVKPKLEKK